MSETSPEENVITKDDRFIIPVMYPPTENTEAGQSKSRTVAISVEIIQPETEAVETTQMGKKKKLKKKGKKQNRSFSLS